VTSNIAYLAGQIALEPESMSLVEGGFAAQARQVFSNLSAVAQACGATLDDCLKLTVYLVDLADFQLLNTVMEECFGPPYPARAAVGVASLPRGALIEVDAVLRVPGVLETDPGLPND
jgi:reactive intermediate/imine deaminase